MIIIFVWRFLCKNREINLAGMEWWSSLAVKSCGHILLSVLGSLSFVDYGYHLAFNVGVLFYINCQGTPLVFESCGQAWLLVLNETLHICSWVRNAFWHWILRFVTEFYMPNWVLHIKILKWLRLAYALCDFASY